ncbi:hypothetical protein ACFLTB_00590 [Chloroflexota bacterium]
MVRYAGMVRGFMEWYGETLDVKPPKLKSLPQYVESNDIGQLIDFIKQTELAILKLLNKLKTSWSNLLYPLSIDYTLILSMKWKKRDSEE